MAKRLAWFLDTLVRRLDEAAPPAQVEPYGCSLLPPVDPEALALAECAIGRQLPACRRRRYPAAVRSRNPAAGSVVAVLFRISDHIRPFAAVIEAYRIRAARTDEIVRGTDVLHTCHHPRHPGITCGGSSSI